MVNWFSRWREFRADAGGARYAGKEQMIAALRGLQRVYDRTIEDKHAPSLNTLKISGKSTMMRLFSTHPPLEERIARLEQLR